MDGDYLPVLSQLEQDTVVVEWDIAVSREDIAVFTAACEAEPSRVRVAPYRIYLQSADGLVARWAHQSAYFRRESRWFISEGEPECRWFGLGLVYLPLAVVRAFIESDPVRPVTDTSFSVWHHDAFGLVPVEWPVRPVHLHY